MIAEGPRQRPLAAAVAGPPAAAAAVPAEGILPTATSTQWVMFELPANSKGGSCRGEGVGAKSTGGPSVVIMTLS